MNLTTKIFSIFLLTFLLITNASCIENNQRELSSKDNVNSIKKKKSKLTFTSGVRAIYEDSKGNLWFGSHAEGVCLYDGVSFQYFTTADGLSNNQVRSIQEDSKGNIWLGTQYGVTKFDGKRFTVQKPIDESPRFDDSYGIRTNQTQVESRHSTTLSIGNEPNLWFNAGLKSGALKYDGNALTYLPFPKPSHINTNNSYAITGIVEGKKNNTWFATFGAVFGFDCKKFTIIEDETLGLSKETGLLHVRSILEDSKGNLWIGNNGIGVLLRIEDKFVDFTKQQKLVSKKTLRDGSDSPQGTLEHVFVIFEDSQGNIWFADRDTGAWRYDGISMTNFTTKEGLSTTHIWAIYETKNNDLLFGMGDGNVCIFDGVSFERKY